MAAVYLTRLVDSGFQKTIIHSAEELGLTLQADPLLAYVHSKWALNTSISLGHVSSADRLATLVTECHAFLVLVRNWAFFDPLGPLQLLSFFGLPITLLGPGGSRSQWDNNAGWTHALEQGTPAGERRELVEERIRKAGECEKGAEEHGRLRTRSSCEGKVYGDRDGEGGGGEAGKGVSDGQTG